MSRDTPRLSLGSVTCDLLAVRRPHTPPFLVFKSISLQAPRVHTFVYMLLSGWKFSQQHSTCSCENSLFLTNVRQGSRYVNDTHSAHMHDRVYMHHGG